MDQNLRTSQDHLWAMGDCIGKYLFKHAADYEAEIVMENAIYGKELETDYSAMPHAVFTRPEVAAVGISEKKAIEKYGEEKISIGFAKLKDTVKGQAIEAKNGFVKVLIHESGKILGAHLVGPHSSVLIQELVLAMENNLSVDKVASSVHIHPALSKVVKFVPKSRFSIAHLHPPLPLLNHL